VPFLSAILPLLEGVRPVGYHAGIVSSRAAISACAALSLFAALLLAIPLVGCATVCVDDFVWITMARAKGTLPEAMAASWNAYIFFRPIDVIANWFVEPITLSIAPILPFQFAGLCMLTHAVWRLQLLLGTASWFSRLAATAWLWLHPATQVSLWAAGATSQTWCAATGIWLINLVLEDQDRPELDAGRLIKYAVMSALGVVLKELFVGWATAAAATVLLLAWMPRSIPGLKPKGATPSLKVPLLSLAAILVPPAAWVGIRLLVPKFGNIVLIDTTHHYSLHGPETVVFNIGLALLGMFVQGPIHWARLLPFPWAAVPFVGAFLSLAWAGYGATTVSHASLKALPGGTLVWFIAMGLLALWPAFGIDHVSELYLMGPNALVATLLGLGVGAFFAPHEGSPRASHGLWEICSATLLALVAIAGFVTRTAHYAVTWSHARALRQSVEEIVRNQPGLDGVTVIIPESLTRGATHCKYIVPPTWAADVESTCRVLGMSDARYANVTFVIRKDAATDPGGRSAVLTPKLRDRPAW
jgi:hypothetical protein